MTGSNLAPDTAREISGLKRRVTDLERMLDRVRRDNAAPTPTTLAPFAAFEGTGYSSAGLHTTDGNRRSYRPANPVNVTLADPTGHITIDGPWTFRIDIGGWYQFGLKASFDTTAPDTGHRAIGVDVIGLDGLENNHRLAIVEAVGDDPTYLTADIVAHSDAGTRWQPILVDTRGVPAAVETYSFWCRLVSTNRAVAGGDVGSL